HSTVPRRPRPLHRCTRPPTPTVHTDGCRHRRRWWRRCSRRAAAQRPRSRTRRVPAPGQTARLRAPPAGLRPGTARGVAVPPALPVAPLPVRARPGGSSWSRRYSPGHFHLFAPCLGSPDIGMAEVIADEQQFLSPCHGKGVAEAVSEVQTSGTATAPAIVAVCLGGEHGLPLIDRNDLCAHGLQEFLQ